MTTGGSHLDGSPCLVLSDDITQVAGLLRLGLLAGFRPRQVERLALGAHAVEGDDIRQRTHGVHPNTADERCLGCVRGGHEQLTHVARKRGDTRREDAAHLPDAAVHAEFADVPHAGDVSRVEGTGCRENRDSHGEIEAGTGLLFRGRSEVDRETGVGERQLRLRHRRTQTVRRL